MAAGLKPKALSARERRFASFSQTSQQNKLRLLLSVVRNQVGPCSLRFPPLSGGPLFFSTYAPATWPILGLSRRWLDNCNPLRKSRRRLENRLVRNRFSRHRRWNWRAAFGFLSAGGLGVTSLKELTPPRLRPLSQRSLSL